MMKSLLLEICNVREILVATQDSNPAIATGATTALGRHRSCNPTMILASEVAFVTT
jgi:hypothetical protein